MKPNFALKLSNDGIELLHRVPGGWSSVGSVSFDSDDVAAGCKRLVDEASRREPGFRTKLVMPETEVRYDAIVAPGPTDEARRYQIEAEIERLTPYNIDDLAYDWSIEDDSALVVICARETLIEAETFADGYGFNPVSFVAQPSAGQFSGEPFFGETMVAPTLLPPGAHVQPDAEAIRVVQARKVEASAPPAPAASRGAPVTPDPASPLPPRPEAAKPAPAATVSRPAAAGPQPGAGVAGGVAAGVSAGAGAAAGGVAAGAAAAGAAAGTVSSAAGMSKGAVPPKPITEPTGPASRAIPSGKAWETSKTNRDTFAPEKTEGGKSEGGIALVGDLVRRMGTRLRREQVQAQNADVIAPKPAAPALPASSLTSSAPAGPSLGAPKAAGAAPKSAETPATKQGLSPDSADKADASVAFSSRRATPSVVSSSASLPAPSPAGGRLAVLPEGRVGDDSASAPKLLSRAKVGALSALAGVTAAARSARAKPATEPATDPAAGPAAAAVTGSTPPSTPPAATPGMAPAKGTGKMPLPAEPATPRAAPVDNAKAREAEAMTIFGARGMQRAEPTIARRGLMAAGGALLLLVAVAIWALYFNTDENTQLAGSSAPLADVAQPAIEAPTELADTEESVTAPDALPAPTPAEPEENVAEAEVIPADPDAMLEALVQQGLDESLETESLEPPVGEVVAAQPEETAPETAPVTEAPAEEAPAETTLAETAPLDEPAPQTETDPQTETPLAAETGPATAQGNDGSESPQLATSESTVQSLSLPRGVETPPAEEVAFAAPPPPPPFGTEFDFDDQGLVVATPEGALTPSGVTVFAGRPNVAPAPRAGSIEVAPAVEAETAPEAAAIEVPSEPVVEAIENAIAEAVGSLQEDVEAAVEAPEVILDDTPRADPALAGARPQPRPESVRALGEQLEQQSEAADGDQTNLAPEAGAETDVAALPAGAASLVTGAVTEPEAEAAATRAGDDAAITDLAALTTPGGLALAGLRPQRRPSDLAALPEEVVEEPELDLTGATAEAVAQSPVPGSRPGDLAERARAILAAAAVQQAAPAAAAPAAAPGAIAAAAPPPAAAPEAQAAARATAAPSIPSSASVTRAATQEDAIRLNRVNLIGVFGSPNDRRALVRLTNGRVVRVQVGDQLDGGQVAAIGDSELRYVKNGRNEMLQIGG